MSDNSAAGLLVNTVKAKLNGQRAIYFNLQYEEHFLKAVFLPGFIGLNKKIPVQCVHSGPGQSAKDIYWGFKLYTQVTPLGLKE